MIDGIVIELTTEQLRAQLLLMAEASLELQRYYEEQASRFLEETLAASAGHSAAGKHASNAVFYTKVAEHLVPNEVFRLTAEQFSKIHVYDSEKKT